MAKISIRLYKNDGNYILLDNKYIKNIDITRDKLKDYSLPVFGSISATGSITFNDVDKTIYNLIQNKEIDYNGKVEIYLKDKPHGVYYMTEPEYDIVNLTFTIQVEDIISRFERIELPEVPLRNTLNGSPTSKEKISLLFQKFSNNLVQITNVVWENESQKVMNDTTIDYTYLKKGTAREQFDTILKLCSSVAYCQKNGNIVITPMYSSKTNVDYAENDKYYFIKRNDMLSRPQANILKTNLLDAVYINNVTNYGEYQSSCSFTINFPDEMFKSGYSSITNDEKYLQVFKENNPQLNDVKIGIKSVDDTTFGVGATTDYFKYIQFYIDLDVSDTLNRFYETNVYSNSNRTQDIMYNGDQSWTVSYDGTEENMVMSKNNLISSEYKTNIDVKFSTNEFWENGYSRWNYMNFNEYNYASGNKNKINRNGYIYIIRLSNNKIRCFCRLVYQYRIFTTFPKGIHTYEDDNGNIGDIVLEEGCRMDGNFYSYTINFKNRLQENVIVGFSINGQEKTITLDGVEQISTVGTKMVYYNSYVNNTKETGEIATIITRSVNEYYEDGLLTADVSILLSDLDVANSDLNNISWYNGETIELGQKVVLLRNNNIYDSNGKIDSLFQDINGDEAVFEVISINFEYNGFPKYNLKLLEINKYWYDKVQEN